MAKVDRKPTVNISSSATLICAGCRALPPREARDDTLTQCLPKPFAKHATPSPNKLWPSLARTNVGLFVEPTTTHQLSLNHRQTPCPTNHRHPQPHLLTTPPAPHTLTSTPEAPNVPAIRLFWVPPSPRLLSSLQGLKKGPVQKCAGLERWRSKRRRRGWRGRRLLSSTCG